MIINIIFKNGPKWNPEECNVVIHHINHGVPEGFMKESLNWLFKNPIKDVTTIKSEDLDSDINWTTRIELADDNDSKLISKNIKNYYKKNVIPELSKIGYNIEVKIVN